MKIRILQIKYKNIREFSDLTINLIDDKDSTYPTSLIQMPNGLGKTTTMHLLRYSLNGMAEKLDEKTVLDFKGKDGDKGEFELKLSINEEIYYILMVFDFNRGKIHYYTSKATQTHSGGRTQGFHLPQDIKALLTPNFVRLFIFDGELASSIIDINKNEAENAIKSLYSIDKILSLIDRIDEAVSIKQEEAESKVTTGQGIKQLKTKLDNAKKKKSEILKENEQIKGRINELQREYDKINFKLENSTTSNTKLMNDIVECETKIRELKDGIVKKTEEIIENARNPTTLHPIIKDRIRSLSSEMLKLKLPRSTSSEFFLELLEQEDPECICGREILEEHKTIIKNKMKDFLTDDQIGVINTIKRSIKSEHENEDIKKLIDDSSELSKKYHKEKTILSQLKGNLTDETENGRSLKEMIEERDEYKKKLEGLEILYDCNTTSDTDKILEYDLNWENNIKVCTDHIRKLEEKYNESLGIISFSDKAKILKEIITEVCKKSLDNLKREIKEKTNIKIKKILNRDDILISDIGSSLKILEHSGVSEGQKLSIAYSFLSSMFEGSMKDLPFLVDSPAGSLDLEVRREVSELIPPLFKQFIVFITSGEKNGFVDCFYKKKDVQFLTLWKEHKTSKKVNLNRDIDFFNKFQSEDDRRQ